MLRYFFFACFFLCSLSIKSQTISCKTGVITPCHTPTTKPIAEKYPYPAVNGIIDLEVAMVDLQSLDNGTGAYISAFPVSISQSDLKNHLSTLFGAHDINIVFTDIIYQLDGNDPVQTNCFLNDYNQDVGDGKIHLLFGSTDFPNSHFNVAMSVADGSPATKAIVGINLATNQDEVNFLAAHELGHCLGLFHTFQDNLSPTRAFGVEVSCSETDDQICDIKQSAKLQGVNIQYNPTTSLCEIQPNATYFGTTNPVDPLDYTFEALHNLMNYFDDFRCAQAFSQEQAAKMRYILLEDPDIKACVSNLSTLPTVPEVLEYVVIDQPTTWNTPKLVAGVIIKQGASLTVQNTTVEIYPSRNNQRNDGGYTNAIPILRSDEEDCDLCGKFVVERGAKLEAYNSTLKPAEIYRPFRWNGIYVEGNYNASQTLANQGFVKLYGCTIEGAKTAIQTRGGKMGVNDGNYLFHGGIIEASNTLFLNNWRDVELMSYRNLQNGIELPNECDFRNCTFQKDNNYGITYENSSSGVVSHQTAYCAISMWGVKGVKVRRCTLTNQYDYQFQEIPGILAASASPKVKNFSSFNGWNNAIEVRNYTANIYNVEVFDSHFSNNKTGIHLRATTNSKIIDNRFDVYKVNVAVGNNEGIPVGLYLQESSSYTVEENEFKALDDFVTDGDAIGAIVYSSGPLPNQINRNSFGGFSNQKDNSVATAAYGVNRSEPTVQNNFKYEGLVFTCNSYGEDLLNDIDIFVRNGLEDQAQAGINKYQGEISAGAENLFSNIVAGKPNILNQSFNEFNYFHNSGDSRLIPTTLTGGGVNVVPTNLTGSFLNNCNVSFTNSSQQGISSLQSELASTNSAINTGETNLVSLIDNGSTPLLEAQILLANAQEHQDLYLDLMGTSPYVSEENLLNLISLDNFPELALRNVMIANPHSSRSLEVMEALYEREPPLSQQTLADIENEMQTITTKDVLEGQLNSLNLTKHKLLRVLSHKYGEDTLGANNSAILNMYASQGDYLSRVTNSMQLHAEGKNLEAKQILDSLQIAIDLTPVESQEIEALKTFYQILIGTNPSAEYLDSTRLGRLDSLTSENHGLAGNLASAILLINGSNNVTTAPRYLPTVTQNKTVPTLRQNRPNKREVFIHLYPNPVNDVLLVQWDWLKSGINNDMIFKLYNQVGQCKDVIELEDFQRNTLTIDLENYPSGVYHLEIQTSDRILDVKQLVKI